MQTTYRTEIGIDSITRTRFCEDNIGSLPLDTKNMTSTVEDNMVGARITFDGCDEC